MPNDHEHPTRELLRSRRAREVRARTMMAPLRTPKRTLVQLRAENEGAYEELGSIDRPVTRGDCLHGVRPCPFAGCAHHLYLDVNPETGSIKLNFPDLEVSDMKHTCALDVADGGTHTLESVGAILNLTRERIRQIDVRATKKAASGREAVVLSEYADEGPVRKRRLPVITDDEDEGADDGS